MAEYYKTVNMKPSSQFDFLKGHDADKNLQDLLNAEFINTYGNCLQYYITTFDTSYDKILGEDNNRNFVRSFDFMAYYKMPEENKMFALMGIDYDDSINMRVSKSHFAQASSVGGNVEYIPQVGDIVEGTYGKLLYEITEIAEGVQEFQQSRKFSWEFVVRPYRKNNITVTPAISGTDAYRLNTGEVDIFDITGLIESQNQNVKYKPINGEKSIQNPFAGM